jgi:lysophospholipase L1-like esterase/cytoskeletal protein CcmA (bactofilin family)
VPRLFIVLLSAVLALGGLMVAPATSAEALVGRGAVIDDPACTATTLPANDDGSSTEAHLPFTINFYGTEYDSLWVNNNGNVTFDGPLSTYTPFGLYATNRAIVAPFFADIDTRAAGSSPVRYGYGTTLFEGHEAFCVNWVDVGYFSMHADKLNSFQLLLVSRTDKGEGAFDIVFNYDKVEWESGDASGGVGGIGGTSARVGFASGDGIAGTATELPGSGVSRAFIDERVGLTSSKLSSNVLGRYVFSVRGDGVVGDKYVALGDSFQSGEGAFAYEEGTDVSTNKCHRAPSAYPQQLVDTGVVRLELDFVACSGAVMEDMSNAALSTDGPPWDEGAQLDHLRNDTRLVTIGIVGNDLKFADLVQGCVTRAFTHQWIPFYDSSCSSAMDEEVDDLLYQLSNGSIGEDLITLYRQVRARAPYARVVVVSYPRFFMKEGSTGLWGCALIRQSDQRWMNSKIERADELIGDIAARAGFEYVNMADVLDGHEQCTEVPGMNGIQTGWSGGPVVSESFHPNRLGHDMMTDRIAAVLNTPVPPSFTIRPGQTVNRAVTASGRALAVHVMWPGSDVVTTLVSPSGTVYTREDPLGAAHDDGPTFEYFEVADPEPGEWTVQMFGADVNADGEPVTLLVADDPVPNVAPTAAFTTSGSGATRVFDASTSVDEDGAVTEYFWDFGDGTNATGVRVEHTYMTAGSFAPVLEVTDDDGARAYRQAATNVELTEDPGAGSGDASGAVYSGSSVQLTNQFATSGDDGDVLVDGDVECNSAVVVAGDLIATGDVHLTDTCRVVGDVHAGGTVVLDSAPSVGGGLDAVGDVRIQTTARVGSDLAAGGTVTVIDGGTPASLVDRGVVGGAVEEGADVAAPAPAAPAAPAVPANAHHLTWSQWLNQTATTNAAPAWSPGLSTTPGCTMAPWAASVNGAEVTVATDTVIDARASTSGCTSATIQGMTLRLGGDVTVLVDRMDAPTGLTVTTTDGRAHTLRVVVEGEISGCSANGAVTFANGARTTDGARLEVRTPGRATLNGPGDLDGRVAAGCFASSGSVTVGAAAR